MGGKEIFQCQCSHCQQENHPDKDLHYKMNLLISRLDEQQRRWYIALEAKKVGYGGIKLLSQITGLDEKTISRGIEELEDGLSERVIDRVRIVGGGRKRVEKKDT